VVVVSILNIRRAGAVAACAAVALAAPLACADSPNAVADPDGFRESITADHLRDLGLDPQQYQFDVPLGRLQFQRTYVRAGDVGTFSAGLTEHGTDVIRLSLNPRGTVEFTQDEARGELYGIELTSSRKRTATLTQSFGGGPTTGTFALTHTDTYGADVGSGFTQSRADKATLTLGLGKSFALSAGAADADSLAQFDTRTHTYDVALAQPGVSIPLAEFHETTTQVGPTQSSVSQMTLRTPTLKLGDKATVSASHSLTESSVTGTDTVDTVNLTAAPTDEVSLTASHVGSEHEAAPDTEVTTVGSQIKVRPDTTVSASLTDTATEGVGTTTQRSVGVAMAPTDGTGLGVEASYTDTNVTNVEVDPTVRVRLTYAAPSHWEFSGLYYDDNSRPNPELGAGVKVPVLGGALGLTYSEYALDPTLNAVKLNRSYGAQLTRPLLWGFSGMVGYQRTDSLADPTVAERIRVGLGGQSTPLGVVDAQYETGQLRTAAGCLRDGSTISLSLSRKIGVAEVALTGKRTLPSASLGPVTPSDEVHLDLKATW
jgi:hypothetical protein